MKNQFLLFIFSLFIFSCTKSTSNSNPSVSTTDIIGRWKIVKHYDKNFPNSQVTYFKSISYADINANTIAYHFIDSASLSNTYQNVQYSYTKDGSKLYIGLGYINIDQLTSNQLILSEYDPTNNVATYSFTLLLTK